MPPLRWASPARGPRSATPPSGWWSGPAPRRPTSRSASASASPTVTRRPRWPGSPTASSSARPSSARCSTPAPTDAPASTRSPSSPVTSPTGCVVGRGLRAVAAAAALLAVAGCSAQGAPGDNSPVANVSVHDSDNLNGSVLPEPYVVPNVPLDGSDGKPYDLATAATKPLTLVFFGY